MKGLSHLLIETNIKAPIETLPCKSDGRLINILLYEEFTGTGRRKVNIKAMGEGRREQINNIMVQGWPEAIFDFSHLRGET